MSDFAPAAPSERPMDFFERLERELRAAAGRAPRRRAGWTPAIRVAAAVAVAAAGLALVLIPVLAVLGGGDDKRPTSAERREAAKLPPVGTVFRKGEGNPPRQRRSTVVATGVSPVTGPWQLEVTRSVGLRDPKTGEMFEPAGAPCLYIHPIDPPDRSVPTFAGSCGSFPRTPGFGRLQFNVPPPSSAPGMETKEVLVYGRVPERAQTVVVTAPGRAAIEVEPQEGPNQFRGDFYVIPVKPGLPGAKINWLDAQGNEGSRGIRLMPPITRH